MKTLNLRGIQKYQFHGITHTILSQEAGDKDHIQVPANQ